jgi:intein/homing endonuclease
METEIITKSKTLNAYPPKSTIDCMLRILPKRKGITLMKYDHLQKSGMHQKLELNGTGNTVKKLGKKEKQPAKDAMNAISHLKTLLLGRLHVFVPMLASQNGEEKQGLITKQGNVNAVEKHSVQTNTKAKNIVLVLAVKKRTKFEAVYNLHVTDQHEFYANGVLVHNCMDAARYALMSLRQGEFVVLNKLGELFDSDL